MKLKCVFSYEYDDFIVIRAVTWRVYLSNLSIDKYFFAKVKYLAIQLGVISKINYYLKNLKRGK